MLTNGLSRNYADGELAALAAMHGILRTCCCDDCHAKGDELRDILTLHVIGRAGSRQAEVHDPNAQGTSVPQQVVVRSDEVRKCAVSVSTKDADTVDADAGCDADNALALVLGADSTCKRSTVW